MNINSGQIGNMHLGKDMRGVIIKFKSFLRMFFIYEYISIIFSHNKQ